MSAKRKYQSNDAPKQNLLFKNISRDKKLVLSERLTLKAIIKLSSWLKSDDIFIENIVTESGLSRSAVEKAKASLKKKRLINYTYNPKRINKKKSKIWPKMEAIKKRYGLQKKPAQTADIKILKEGVPYEVRTSHTIQVCKGEIVDHSSPCTSADTLVKRRVPQGTIQERGPSSTTPAPLTIHRLRAFYPSNRNIGENRHITALKAYVACNHVMRRMDDELQQELKCELYDIGVSECEIGEAFEKLNLRSY